MKLRYIPIIFSVSLVCLSVMNLSAQITYNAEDFGIYPDDGRDDKLAINNAVTSSFFERGGTLVFQAGIYNLKEDDGTSDPLIDLSGIDNIKFQGAVDDEGNPITIFERNLSAPNAKEIGCKVMLMGKCENIVIQNICFSNNPEYSSAAVVKTVNKSNDNIEVEVFDDLPHFDGMYPCSANAWDLETRELLPVEHLSIGTNTNVFSQMRKVEGDNPRLYSVSGMGLSEKLKVGDGMSWHFYVTGSGGQLDIRNSKNITLENIHMYNSRHVSIMATFSQDLTFRKVELRPSGNQLAVGSRDAIHFICNTGDFLMEECYIKGYRWDPINVKSKICRVEEIIDNRTIEATTIISYKPSLTMADNTVVFWSGEKAIEERFVNSEIWEDGNFIDIDGDVRKKLTLTFSEDLPSTLRVGDGFTPHNWNFNSAVFKKCVFEGNFGRPILYQGENLTIDSCTFYNNAYANIALGPINIYEGGFVRNATIKNSTFTNSTWRTTTASIEHNGTIKIYQSLKFANEPYNYAGEAYNQNIVIENNHFSGINYTDNYAAIDVANASNVSIRNNDFDDNKTNIQIDRQSTLDIGAFDNTAIGSLGKTKNDIKICPNPVTNGIFSFMSLDAMVQNVEIYDIYGNLLKSVRVQQTIDVTELDSGLYWLKIQTNDSFEVKTLIIKS